MAYRRVPVLINCRDRVSCLIPLVEWLEAAGHKRITLLDNASTWPPLLDYYRETPHEVVYLEENLGNKALWAADMVPAERFVYTDPDVVPVEECPANVVEYLGELLDRRPEVPKAGLGIYWDDVPEPYYSGGLAEIERFHVHENEVEPGAHLSEIDTTFALYQPGAKFAMKALRLDMPYMARHLPFYSATLSEEDVYYCDHAIQGRWEGSSWSEYAKELGLR